ncbi:hypothetical protein ACJMK2_012609 [Sinanodonta woodiana]|uniref:Chitin-binding type-2 domain-containing protein n=1 Tax=Sinanodonta woodiana TaxID=1069815 RepID=A0ABD3V8R6_SINWO
MKTIFLCAVLVATFATSLAVNCTTLPDGSYEAGCRSFAVCKGGVGLIVDCEPKKVFNNNTGLCDDVANVSPPCGLARTCTGKPNGKYADVDLHCSSYYTCYEEKFLGHNICPAGLVFDEGLVTCNWREAVPPPCGTKH